MLNTRLNEAKLLISVLEAIKKLVSECTFDCDDSGIALQAMDNSHVPPVSMMLCSDGFDLYRCDRNLPRGIDLGLIFESIDCDKISECDLKLMDIDSEHLGIPDTTYDAAVHMSSMRFQETVRDLQRISDSGTTLVVIECTKEGIKFSCEGEVGKGGITLKALGGQHDSTVIELRISVAMTFSIKYFVNFTKVTPLSNHVSVNLSNEVPLLVEYKLGDLGTVRYCLAPKIGEE